MKDLIHLDSFVSNYISSFQLSNCKTVLKMGALRGLTIFWICQPLGKKVLKTAEEGAKDKGPLPIIFTGMLGVAVIESIGLVYEISRRVLGERSLFDHITFDEVDLLTSLNRCRYRMWKVIFWLERHVDIIDTVYSRIFRIRTEKEVQNKAIPERQLDFMEVVRIAFKLQVQETIHKPYPAHGYTLLLINVALGMSDKINQILQRVQIERIEEKNKSEENKVYYAILEVLASQYKETHSFDFPVIKATNSCS